MPVVFTTQEAALLGFGRHHLTARVRRGEWRRLRRGVFCTARVWDQADRRGRHLLQTVAAARTTQGAHVSHLSAAAHWGWPLPLEPTRAQVRAGAGDPLDRRWLTRPPSPGATTEARHGLRLLVAPLPPQDVVPRDGWSVTSCARTVADCLRHLPAEDAVAVADAAAAQRVTRADVVSVLARQDGWWGQPAALERLELVDPRRESWLESWSAARLVARGIPLPESQARVFGQDGRFIGRVDWWWPRHGVVGEADGPEKHRRGLTGVGDVDRVMREEKDREDALRDEGLQVVRYGTAAAVELDALVGRIERALRRGDPAQVTALVRSTVKVGGW